MTTQERVEPRVRSLIEETTAPDPGSGDTGQRWARLTAMAAEDIVVGRLVEAHWDAGTILRDIGWDHLLAPGQWWGVWAAEPPQPYVRARRLDDGTGPSGPGRADWVLEGAKPWCSGAEMCTHALVTAREREGTALFAVDLGHRGVSYDGSGWQTSGMARSRTWTTVLDRVPAVRVGSHDDYLQRPGFWHGGAGVAACWLGGAVLVAKALRRKASTSDNPLLHAELGLVDATLQGALWAMQAAARELDANPDDQVAARIRAMRLRALVEEAATTVLDRVGRALGAGPLAMDADHARAVADLQVYIRQSHGPRDLATLGGLLKEQTA